MAKQFWEKWEYRAWLADSNLTSCDESTRGIWVDWLNHMMEGQTYFLTGTLSDLARMGRTSKGNALAALLDLFKHDAAKIEVSRNAKNDASVTLLSRTYNGEITVVNRRRERQFKSKELNRLRQERYRLKTQCNAPDDGQSKSNKSIVTKVTQEKEVALAPKQRKGSRIPDPFLLTPVLRSWAADRRPAVDVVEETEKFANHFRSAPGQKGVKLNWELTWKNWILNARGQNGTNRQDKRESTRERFEGYGDAIEQFPTDADLGRIA